MSTVAFGQVPTEDDLSQTSSLFQAEFTSSSNKTGHLQSGNRNQLDARQYQTGAIGNLLETRQEGNRNKINVIQSGSANQSIINQIGNRNEAILTVTGEANKALILQQGNNNRIEQEILNSTSVQTTYIQQGNANQIIHKVDGEISKQYQLLQKGNGNRAILLQKGN